MGSTVILLVCGGMLLPLPSGLPGKAQSTSSAADSRDRIQSTQLPGSRTDVQKSGKRRIGTIGKSKKYGIHLIDCHRVNIGRATISRTEIGIFIEDCTDVVIEDSNVFENKYIGIYIKGGKNNIVRRNSVNNNGLFGVLIEGGVNNREENNTARNNGLSDIVAAARSSPSDIHVDLTSSSDEDLLEVISRNPPVCENILLPSESTLVSEKCPTPGSKLVPGTAETSPIGASGSDPQGGSRSWRTVRPGVARDAVGRTLTEKQITFDLGGGVMMEVVLIPAGSFMMGDSKTGRRLVHKVTITQPYYLGKYEVTQEQWQAVMGNNPSRFKGRKNPVTWVGWNDAQGFLSKLNKKFAHTGKKFSLPTEAQWEYACRAGSTTRYSFGDDEASLRDYAWFEANSDDKTHPVGQKKPNAWGLYDMHGNVFEWCRDWYDMDYYGKSPTDDPSGPTTGLDRLLRSGSYCDRPMACRSAFRHPFTPEYRFFDVGFRLALVPVDVSSR